MILSYKIWISFGMNVNYDVQDRSKDIHSCSKQMSTYVDNLIKHYRAFMVLVANVFEKI